MKDNFYIKILHMSLQKIPPLASLLLCLLFTTPLYGGESQKELMEKEWARVANLPVPSLIKELKSSDPDHRRLVLIWMSRKVHGLESAIPVLVETLKDKVATNRYWATVILAAHGPKGRNAVPDLNAKLREILNSKNNELRCGVVQLLPSLGPKGHEFIPDLIPLLNDKNEDNNVRMGAMSALGRFGPAAKRAVPELIKALQGFTGAMFAAEGLGGIGPEAKEAIPALIGALDNPRENVRVNAAEALGKIGPASVKAVPRLIKMLGEGGHEVRGAAAEGLGGIGPLASQAVPELTKNIWYANNNAARKAAVALGRIGAGAMSAIPDIEKRVKKKPFNEFNWDAKKAIQQIRAAIARGDTVPKPVRPNVSKVPVFQGKPLELWKEQFESNPKDSRFHVSQAFHNLGEPGYRFLLDKINGQDKEHRALALSIIYQTKAGNTTILPILLEALDHKDGKVKLFCVMALGNIGPKASPSVGKLRQLFTNASNINLKRQIIQVLGKIGPGSAAALPEVLVAYRSKNRQLYEASQFALLGMGKGAKEAAPTILKSYESANSVDRFYLLSVLAKIAPENPDVQKHILAGLNDKDHNLCSAAARALGDIGPKIKGSLTALIERLKPPDKQYDFSRKEVLKTLTLWGPKAKKALPAIIAVATFVPKKPELSWEIRMTAITAMVKIDSQDPSVVKAMIELIYDKTIISILAIRSLKEVGPAAVAALPKLGSMLRSNKDHGSWADRIAILEAMLVIDPQGEKIIPDIVASLDDPSYISRRKLIEAVTKFGQKAKTARPQLERLLADKSIHSVEKLMVKKALASIGP